jgi:hypothetical protein
MPEPIDEKLIDEVASVMANMDAKERADLAQLLGLTPAELDQVIANWKADKLQ